MTEFKGTPGPWFPALLYGYMTGVRAQNPETGRWVAHAWCQTSTPTSHEAHAKQVAQNEANARLIAAAPELLDALWVCMEHNKIHFGEAHNTVIQARAAIAKALGETK